MSTLKEIYGPHVHVEADVWGSCRLTYPLPQLRSRNTDILSMEGDLSTHRENLLNKDLALNKLQVVFTLLWSKKNPKHPSVS